MLHRRTMLGVAVSAGSAALMGSASVNADEQAASPDGRDDLGPSQPGAQIVDTNVHLFQWPCRRLPLDEARDLRGKLRSLGVREAWAGSFEALLHRDLSAVNQRLAAACGEYPEFVAIGAINPLLPDWEEDLRRCAALHQMPGIRLYPSYHGYTLQDECFAQVLRKATQLGRFVQIIVAMEDQRTQHPLLQVPDVDLAPLPDVLQQISESRVQLLNHRTRPTTLARLAKAANLSFDVARVESTDGVATLVRQTAPERVMYGSHAPLLIPAAALIRTAESRLDPSELQRVLSNNACQFRNKLPC